MKIGQFWIVVAVVLPAMSPAPTLAATETGKPACEKIFNICMKRAGSGHAAICEDFYRTAKATGTWPATQDEQGRKYDPVPCTP